MKTKEKLTPWFTNGQMPYRPGVYNVTASISSSEYYEGWFAKWDGNRWYCAYSCIKLASKSKGKMHDPHRWHRYGAWRGLAYDPKKEKPE